VSRVAAGLRRRAEMLRMRGDAVRCPVCGHGFRAFKDEWNRTNAKCWRCGSHERHRALWLLFERRPELLRGARSLLHFAPEWSLEQRLRERGGLRYVTTDLDPSKGELALDIHALALPDAAFDAVLCSHVLEHVDDAALAMRELRRITAPGGWAIVMVPLDHGRAETYEDPSITSQLDRERAFGQHDHVRLFGRDVAGRLQAAGFDVEEIRMTEELGPEATARHGLLHEDVIFLCRPR
jgi:SAM-dependent methyltransferase